MAISCPAVPVCTQGGRGGGSFSVLGAEIFQLELYTLYWGESMGLRWGRTCKEMVGWSLASRGRGERRRALTPHQDVKTLTQLSRAQAKPRTAQKSRACLSTSQSDRFLSTSQSDRLADQSTFGAGCLNRPVDDRLFGLTVVF